MTRLPSGRRKGGRCSVVVASCSFTVQVGNGYRRLRKGWRTTVQCNKVGSFVGLGFPARNGGRKNSQRDIDTGFLQSMVDVVVVLVKRLDARQAVSVPKDLQFAWSGLWVAGQCSCPGGCRTRHATLRHNV